MLTREIANDLAEALREQLGRCPSCYGVGTVREDVAYRPCFCLVCEEPAKALYQRMQRDAHGMADLSNSKVFTRLAPIYDRLAKAAVEFVKRCPGCFGVGTVWAAERRRPCLVCARLRRAIDTYTQAVTPDQTLASALLIEEPEERGRQI